MLRVAVLAVLLCCVCCASPTDLMKIVQIAQKTSEEKGRMTLDGLKQISYLADSPFLMDTAVTGMDAGKLLNDTTKALVHISSVLKQAGSSTEALSKTSKNLIQRLTAMKKLQKMLIAAYMQHKNVGRDFTVVFMRLALFGTEGDLPCTNILETALLLKNCSENKTLTSVQAVLSYCRPGMELNKAYTKDMKCTMKRISNLVHDLSEMHLGDSSSATDIQMALARIQLFGMAMWRDTAVTNTVLSKVWESVKDVQIKAQ